MDAHLFERFETEVIERLDEVCQEFEKAWRERHNPRAEEFLEGVAWEIRVVFEEELLRLEVEYRLRREGPSSLADLALRFPHRLDLIRALAAIFAADHGPSTRSDGAAPAPSLPDLPGYEVVSLIGRGGMGVVYRARDRRLSRTVAVKMLGFVGEDDQARRRFRAEAEFTAHLQHPHIVQIFDVGEHEGRPFIALEYLAGGSLRDRLRRGHFDPREAAVLVATLADAIDYAHTQGIIHRDLKPDNILFQHDDPAGSMPSARATLPSREISATSRPSSAYPVKIADFGLAKMLGSDYTATRTGDVIGTPHYMAPEQVHRKVGDDLGPSVDVYALGAILYELLSGLPPFWGESSLEVIQKLATHDPTPPRKFRLGLPRDLESICMKCLERRPSARYASGADLAADLMRYLRGDPVLARPIGTMGRSWRSFVRRPVVASLLVALSLVTAIGSATLAVLDSRSRRHEKVASEAERTRNDLQKAAELQVGRRWSSAASQMLELEDLAGAVVWSSAALDLHQRLLGAGSPEALKLERWHRTLASSALGAMPRLLADRRLTEPATRAWFDASGRELRIELGDGQALVWDWSTGKPPAPVLPGTNPSEESLSLGRNGRYALKMHRSSLALERWDTKKGRLDRKLMIPADWGGQDWHSGVLSDDGGLALIQLTTDETLFALADLENGRWITPKPIMMGRSRATPTRPRYARAAFAGGSRAVLTWNLDGEARVWDASTGSPITPVLRHPTGVTCATLDDSGRLLATGTVAGTVQLWDLATGKAIPATFSHASSVNSLSYDHSGDRLVGAGQDGIARVWDVPGARPLGEPMRHGGPVRSARFGPDDRGVVTASDDGLARIWDCASGRLLAPPLVQGTSLTATAMSDDGRLVFVGSADGRARVWDLSGGRPTSRLLLGHSAVVDQVRFSPDGSRLLSGGGDDQARIWRVLDGLTTAILPHGGPVEEISWDETGRKVSTCSLRGFRAWESDTGRPTMPLMGRHLGADTGVDEAPFIPGGLVAIRYADHVNLFDPASRMDSDQIELFQARRMAVTADGSKVALTNPEHVIIYDRATRQFVGRWSLDHPAADLAFSPDGSRLAAAGPFGLRVWMTSGASGGVALADRPFQMVRFSADSRRLLALDERGQIQIRDAESWAEIGPPLAVGGNLVFAAFDPPGDRVVTARGDGQARAWDVSTGLPLTPPLEHGGAVRGADLSPDGRSLAVAGTDGAVRIWDLPASDGRPLSVIREQAERVAARRFRGGERDPGLVPIQPVLATAGADDAVAGDRIFSWHRSQADDARRVGQWSAAVFHLERMASIRPNLPEVPRKLAEVHERSGNRKALLAALDAVLALGPEDVEVRARRGRALAEEGRWAEALDDFDDRGRADLDANRVWRSAVLVGLGRFDEADRAYRVAARGSLGRIAGARPIDSLTDLSETTLARKPYRALLAILARFPGKGEGLVAKCRGLAHAQLGEWVDAEGRFREALLEDPNDAEAHRGIALARMKLGRPDEALLAITHAIEAEPGEASFRLLRARLHQEGGRQAEALSDASRAIESGLDALAALEIRGRAALALGLKERALADLEVVISKEPPPGSPGLIKEAARLRASRGDHREAIAHFQRILRVYPGEWEAVRGLLLVARSIGREDDARLALSNLFRGGHLYFDAEELQDKLWTAVLGSRLEGRAIPWIDRFASLIAGMGDPKYVRTLGGLEMRIGRWDDAEKHLRASIDRGGGKEADWLLLAMVQRHQGRSAEARASLARAEPEKSSTPSWLAEMESLALRKEAEALVGK